MIDKLLIIFQNDFEVLRIHVLYYMILVFEMSLYFASGFTILVKKKKLQSRQTGLFKTSVLFIVYATLVNIVL